MRARLIGGLPTDLVGSLSGLTQGHFPVFAKARYADDLSERAATRRVDDRHERRDAGRVRRARAAASTSSPTPARRSIAVQDGTIVVDRRSPSASGASSGCATSTATRTRTRTSRRSRTHVPVPKHRTQSTASIATRARAAEGRPEADARRDRRPPDEASARRSPPRPTPPAGPTRRDGRAVAKERLFAHPGAPQRAAATAAPASSSTLESDARRRRDACESYFTGVFGLDAKDVVLKPLVAGRRVIAGTILGRIGTTSQDGLAAPALRDPPAGRGAPRIDPKPILDGWKLLESTAIYRAQGSNALVGATRRSASIGQILLMSKEALAQRVLANPRIEIYSCGRRDIEAGVDRPPRARDARVPRRQRPEADGHLAALRPRLLHRERQRLRALRRQRRRHREDQRHPDPRPPGRGLDHRHHDPPAADAAGHDEAPPDHQPHDLRRAPTTRSRSATTPTTSTSASGPSYAPGTPAPGELDAVLKPVAVDQAHRPPRPDRQPDRRRRSRRSTRSPCRSRGRRRRTAASSAPRRAASAR